MKRLPAWLAAACACLGLCLCPALASRKHLTWLERANADPTAARLTNPYTGQEDAVKAGEKLYQRYCSSCHGTDLAGVDRNPSLRSPTVRSASPGALFWLLRNGSLERGMPGWSYLPPQQRWQLVTWLKAME